MRFALMLALLITGTYATCATYAPYPPYAPYTPYTCPPQFPAPVP